MKMTLKRYFQLLFILFVISFISWFIVLFTTPDNIPFLFGSISSWIGICLVIGIMTGKIIVDNKEDISKSEEEKK